MNFTDAQKEFINNAVNSWESGRLDQKSDFLKDVFDIDNVVEREFTYTVTLKSLFPGDENGMSCFNLNRVIRSGLDANDLGWLVGNRVEIVTSCDQRSADGVETTIWNAAS